MSDTIVVAGVWARPLAEAALQAGWRAIALDLFGDADTRRASVEWRRIGSAATLRLDPALLRVALHAAAREPHAIGWVAGSGFESAPDLLDLVVPGLPLLGMAGDAVRRVRAPASFFPMLARLGLKHPPVSLVAPADPRGWLVKNAASAGGWQVRPADGAGVPAGGDYWQRRQAGEPMSALFLADGRGARIVALHRLLVAPQPGRPFVFAGVVGPIVVPALAARVQSALDALVPAFALRGLASLDFLAQDDEAWLLEINPRPSASMVLHPHAWTGGLLRAHVEAVHGRLPATPARQLPGVRGWRSVLADRPCRVGLALAAELARSPDCHDLPAPGTSFGPGDPVCSVSAEAGDFPAVLAALAARGAELRAGLSPPQELAA